MKNKTFEVLLTLLNNIISILNQNDYKIYDAENPEFFISNIRYDNEDDIIKFDTEKQ